MKKIFCAVVCLLLVCGSFAQTSRIIRYLPSNTGMVVAINPFQLSKKVPAEIFRQSFVYREMMKENNAELNAFFSDPASLGVDVSSDLLITMEADTTNPWSSETINIFGVLKNPGSFTSNMKKFAGERDAIQTYGTDKIIVTDEYGPSLAWNNEIFVITTGNNRAARQMMSSIWNDTAAVVDYESRMEEVKTRVLAMAKERCFSLLTPNDQSALVSNIHLNGVLQEQGDIRIWNNGMSFLKSFGQIFMRMGMPGFQEKLAPIMGTDKTSVVNFENGKITGNSRNYVAANIADLYKKFPPVSQNAGLIRRLPADGNLIAVFNVSAHPELAKEMMKSSGLGELFDSLKTKLPFDPALLTSSFGNQAMLAVVNMPKEENITEEDLHKRSKNPFAGIHIILAAPIKNKESFEKLYSSLSDAIAELKKKIRQEKEMENEDDEEGSKGGFFVEMLNELKLSVKYNDSLFVLSASDKITEAFIKDAGNRPAPAWFEATAKYPSVFRIGLNEFINTVYKNAGSPSEKEDVEIKKLLDNFGDIVVTGGDFSNGSINSHAEISFANKDQNALQQIFEFMNSMAENTGKGRNRDGVNVEMKRFTPPVIMKDEEITDGVKIVEVEEEIPTFSDPEVQDYVNDYTAFLKKYIKALKEKDTEKLEKLSKDMEKFSKRSTGVANKLAAKPEEAKKFADYFTKLAERLTEAGKSLVENEQEATKDPEPPPPPKSKTKSKN